MRQKILRNLLGSLVCLFSTSGIYASSFVCDSDASTVMVVVAGDKATVYPDHTSRTKEYSPLKVTNGPCCGRPTVYEREDFELKVNWTTAPTSGGHHGTLRFVDDETNKHVTQVVVCRHEAKKAQSAASLPEEPPYTPEKG